MSTDIRCTADDVAWLLNEAAAHPDLTIGRAVDAIEVTHALEHIEATYTVHLADGTTELHPVADGLGALQASLAGRRAHIHATGPNGCPCAAQDEVTR